MEGSTVRHFATEFAPRFYELNARRQAGPVVLLHYLEEAAVSHSGAAGCSLQELEGRGVGWVLNRWYIVVERYPVWDEKVSVETWPAAFDRFYATREFIVRGRDNTRMARATSRWIYLSVEKKRPLRIPEGFARAYGLDPERAVEHDFAALPVRQGEWNLTTSGKRIFAVRRSDLDGYHHVNNAQYVQWLLESVPEQTYDLAELQSLEIEYRKEVGYGGRVRVDTLALEPGAEGASALPEGGQAYLHSIEDADTLRELAVARTIWKRQE
ncbi:HotDog domain protein [Acididesulfobacillus acetoxydans]|uniref:Acyl-ACP thioesterase n=1 Tax=Acididesulfobacillus acetoxydans TaxID=1561005 RepID=A0A8S0WG58_9FIRM|nr:acyl-ACP thioesterase domain-containing protein [Acididesulfobacillus acetoxydans]CAA7601612.1 HotDog domain protein [Acididesulfobacillus acetoxydans]CEJ07099.1 Acyl-ACP thioesterase [Acididesulfobacillus acetoxydans]